MRELLLFFYEIPDIAQQPSQGDVYKSLGSGSQGVFRSSLLDTQEK